MYNNIKTKISEKINYINKITKLLISNNMKINLMKNIINFINQNQKNQILQMILVGSIRAIVVVMDIKKFRNKAMIIWY